MALDGGEDGFDFYRKIVPLWKTKLKAGGAIAFELGENQLSFFIVGSSSSGAMW